MLTITAIGSCRVATPLRLCRETHGFKINKARIYGFSHTSCEAVQQMRFLKGDVEIPEFLWPLVAGDRPDSYRLRTEEVHEPSDMYVVEIASMKELSIGPLRVQLNYMKRAFREFHEDIERVRTLYRLASEPDPEQLMAWLEANWTADEQQVAESEILQHLRMSMATVDTIAEDMDILISGLPNVLFVTHVDALLPNGTRLPGRVECIAAVKSAGRRVGAQVYDATSLMQTVGQNLAIEDHSTSLAHFTEPFSREVLDAWYEEAVQDVIERLVSQDPADAISKILVPHARAYLSTRDPERIIDIEILVDVVESYFPDDIHAPLFRFELAVARAADPAIDDAVRKAFTQMARTTPLAELPQLRGQLIPLESMFAGLLKALSEDTDVPKENQRWLKSTARYLKLDDLITGSTPQDRVPAPGAAFGATIETLTKVSPDAVFADTSSKPKRWRLSSLWSRRLSGGN